MPVVLVVDDEPDIRALMKINLEAAGYSVVTAASGEEALALVHREPPDAMLLDLMMPGIDGAADAPPDPRVRLTRLEHAPASPPPTTPAQQSQNRLASLTAKQRRLVDELTTGASVATVAREVGTSRSSVYASVRRICRKLDLVGTRDLLELVRHETRPRDS